MPESAIFQNHTAEVRKRKSNSSVPLVVGAISETREIEGLQPPSTPDQWSAPQRQKYPDSNGYYPNVDTPSYPKPTYGVPQPGFSTCNFPNQGRPGSGGNPNHPTYPNNNNNNNNGHYPNQGDYYNNQGKYPNQGNYNNKYPNQGNYNNNNYPNQGNYNNNQGGNSNYPPYPPSNSNNDRYPPNHGGGYPYDNNNANNYPNNQGNYPSQGSQGGSWGWGENGRQGRWVPCRPLDLSHAGIKRMDCSGPSSANQNIIPPATPVSKVDDKVLFNEADVEEITP